MEVDWGPMMLPVSIGTRHLFDLLNLGVECLRKGIGYSVFQVCQVFYRCLFIVLATLLMGRRLQWVAQNTIS